MRRLPRREVELLLRLCASPGETVPREQLLAEVWSRRMVNDEVLSRAVAALRQALDDDAREPSYIETIPKVGYRMLAPVRTTDPAQGGGGDRFEGAPSADPAPPAPAPSRRAPTAAIAASLAAAIALGVLAWRQWSGQPHDPFRVENMLRAQPLTSDPGWELSPRFTPDGRSVLYSRVERPEDETATIWIRSVDGAVSRKLVDDGNANFCPVPSPDGTRVAWLRFTSAGCTLMERPILGEQSREVTACARARSCPEWTADGAALVYSAPAADGDHGPSLTRIALATLERQPLTRDTPRDAVDMAARRSPDGTTLAFQRGTGWGGRYFMVPIAGGTPKPITERPEMNYGVAWAPDGKRLLLATDAIGYRALAVQAVAGGEPTLLGGRGARFPDVSPDGALVWEHAEYDANLWLAELGPEPGPSRQLTTARRYDAQPELSPDGKRVAFMSNRDGGERIYLLELDSGEERAIPSAEGERWSQVAWSPDGAALTAIGYEGKVARGCVRVLASSHTECPEPLRGVEALRVEAGGTFLALRGSDEKRDLVRIDAKGGSETVLAEYVERFVPAGARLVLQHKGAPGLAVSEGGRELAIAAEFGTIGRGQWSATPAHVYVASSRGPQGAGIYRIAFGDPRAVRVSPDVPDTVGPALTITPDERHAVMAKTDRLDVDLHWVPPP